MLLGKVGGAVGGYTLGYKLIDVFPEDESKITDYYVMLIDKSNNMFWLSSGNPELITSNPQNAVMIHRGEQGINSKSDLENKLKSDKFDEVFKDFKINVVGIDSTKANENVIGEGIVSTAIKTGARILGKAIARVSPKAGKVLSKPVMKRAGTFAAKKLIRSKLFRNAIRTISRSKVYSVLKNKKLIQTAIKVGDKAMFADTCMDVYDMIKDYSSGKYRDVSWETVAAAGGTLIYTVSPKEITSGDPKFDKEIAKEGFDSIKEDLRKYKEWKAANNGDKKLALASESKSTSLLFEETKTYRTYFNIILESAQTDAEKLKVIEKADPKFAKILKNSVDKSGNVKIQSSDAAKVKKLINKDQIELNKIKSANHKVTKENVNKILKSESAVKSIASEIFSKETLISLIPFSTKPTIGDIGNFFSALHDWSAGKYKFSDEDISELVSIGVDVGIQTIILVCGGVASFMTFGISMILAIIGCASTIGYIFDSMTRIGRNYAKNKSTSVPTAAPAMA